MLEGGARGDLFGRSYSAQVMSGEKDTVKIEYKQFMIIAISSLVLHDLFQQFR